VKNSLIIACSLLAVVSLAACKQEAKVPNPAETATASGGMPGMPGMPMAGEMMHGMSTGTVTEIDSANGTITLDHGAITELKWKPMTMSFSARPELLSGIKVGDKVNFEIDWDGKNGTVTRIEESGT